MKKHLKYYIVDAYHLEIKNQMEDMDKLGISYKDFATFFIADIVIFADCDNIPNELPSYLSFIELTLEQFTFLGISKERAKKLVD